MPKYKDYPKAIEKMIITQKKYDPLRVKWKIFKYIFFVFLFIFLISISIILIVMLGGS
ncbi:MAG: hypothetical protein TYPL_4810 [Candidatus Tyloplasma litorale]|nr:MAG: hypothetical protein TYPL_4810 [Mycoplasmatales bacterium]